MAAYVRTKRVGTYEYYQLVENHRIDGKPRQNVLIHLGEHPTVDDALKKWPTEIKRLRRYAAKERESAKAWPETSGHHRNMLERAASTDKRADSLEANLKKLRELRKEGIV